MKKYFTIVAMALMTIHANAWEETLLFEKDWTSASEYDLDLETENDPDYQLALGADGLAITNLSQRDWAENSQTIVAQLNLALETKHDYIVRLTMKAPSEGTYQVKLETADVNIHPNMSAIAKASDDFQEIDFPFYHFSEGVDGEIKIHLGNGLLVGTTILQKVQVLERTKSVAAEGQLGYWNNKGLVELTPVESIVYKFVWALDDESQQTIKGLYDNMKETGDKSIIKCSKYSGDFSWYVRKDYPLPEGKFFESDIYEPQAPNGSNALDGQLEVVIPQINCYVNWRGRVEDLLEYLGDQVTVDYISEPDLSGGRTCRFISNLKTSKETLELGMRVHDLDMEGVKNFHSRVFSIDKIYESHLISMLTDTNEDKTLVFSMNWEGADVPMTCVTPDDPWKSTEEGLAIVNPKMQEFAGSIWTIISGVGFPIFEDKDYLVRLTMKVPSDGTYEVNMFDTNVSVYKEVPVYASDDFQVIDILFTDLANNKMEGGDLDHNAMIFLKSGWVVGTTVLKKVEVYEKLGSGARDDKTAVNAVKTTNADGAIYNLAGQKVDASYKGIVIQNGKKRIAR